LFMKHVRAGGFTILSTPTRRRRCRLADPPLGQVKDTVLKHVAKHG
jgi:hypothetical protein